MYQVVRETRQIWDNVPHAHAVPETAKDSFMVVLDIALQMAKEHASRVSGDKPFRLGNGFRFQTGGSTCVTYEVRKV